MKTREDIVNQMGQIMDALKESPPKLEWPVGDLSIDETVALCREHGMSRLTIYIEIDSDAPEVSYTVMDKNYKTHKGNTRREALRAALAHLAPTAPLPQLVKDLAEAGDGSAKADASPLDDPSPAMMAELGDPVG